MNRFIRCRHGVVLCSLLLIAGMFAAACASRALVQRADVTVNVVDAKGVEISGASAAAAKQMTITTFRHPRADSRGISRDRALKVGTEALGLNDMGLVVGDFTDQAGVVRGYVMENVRDTRTLRVDRTNTHDIEIDGATFTRAYAVNNNGLIVGVYRDAEGTHRGFRLTVDEVKRAANKPIKLERSQMIDMGSTNTQALGVNEIGTVVGGYLTKEGLVRPFMQRAGRDPEPIPLDRGEKYINEKFISAFDITNDGFILGNYGEINEGGFYMRSRTFLLSPALRTVADFDVGFPATNSGLGINSNLNIVGMCGPKGGTCGGNVSFYQTVSNPNPMRTSGAPADLAPTRMVFRVTNRVSTAMAKLNSKGMFVGTTDSEAGALVGLVGSVSMGQ